MSYIFIRHGEKKYDNGNGYPRFDPPIIDKNPNKNIKDINPDIIITSPMLRCRETSILNFPDNNYNVNNLLTEYLGNHKEYKREDFEKSTYEYIKNFEFEKNTKELYKRLYLARMSLPVIDNDTIIVIITHGICLEYLYDIFRKENKVINFFGKFPKDGYQIMLK